MIYIIKHTYKNNTHICIYFVWKPLPASQEPPAMEGGFQSSFSSILCVVECRGHRAFDRRFGLSCCCSCEVPDLTKQLGLWRTNWHFGPFQFGDIYRSWVVWAGVGSALADILGDEYGQRIDSIIQLGRGGVSVTNSMFLGGRGVWDPEGFESSWVQGCHPHSHPQLYSHLHPPPAHHPLSYSLPIFSWVVAIVVFHS